MPGRFILISAMMICLLAFGGRKVSAQGFESLLKRSLEGDSIAMLAISEAYQFGKGVERNEDSANIWISRAANTGLTEAQFLEGLRLSREIFSEKKFKEGVRLLILAADKGNVAAMERLFTLYISQPPENTSGSVFLKFRDPSKAIQYSLLAAEAGSLNGIKGSAFLLMQGDKGLARDSLKAAAFMQRAATEFDDPEAQLTLALWYFDRRVTGRPEPFLAWPWVNKAFNNPRANLDLGTQADIERHRIDQYIKRLHNASLHNAFFLKPGQAFVPIRQL